MKKNRKRIDQELSNIEERQFFSPALLALVQKIIPEINEHAHGQIIDIGCGDMPFKRHLEAKGTVYDTLDIEERAGGVKYIASVLDMSVIKEQSYDTAVCLEVLEHVPQPFVAVQQINRILKTNGVLILSVPHLSRLHEEPHDYFRYTHHGLRTLLETNGFQVLKMEVCGGPMCFFGHQLSTVLLCLCFHIPLVKHIIFFLNKWFISMPYCWIDEKLFKNFLMPLGYICVAKKN